MNLTFSVWERRADGSLNRRFEKLRYTAALRLGIVVEPKNQKLELRFSGEIANAVNAHEGNVALRGTLHYDSSSFDDVIVIVRNRNDGRFDLVTFWPTTQDPEAHRSYTDPLVDTAMDGTPFPLEVVATKMHAAFLRNAGTSPATLMKLIYEAQNVDLQIAAARYGALLEESLDREQQIAAALQNEKAARREAELNEAEAKAELERYRLEAVRVAPPGTVIRPSNISTLVRVEIGRRGRDNQPAILLHMSDGTVRANNWSKDFEARLNYARRLEGRQIKTDVWGTFPWEQWFQNIYPVDD